MYDEMIKDILTKKIKNFKKEQENIQKDYQKQYDKQQNIINTLLDIKANILKLKDLDIKNTFKNLDNLSLELLKFYQIVLKQGYSLQESDLEKLNSESYLDEEDSGFTSSKTKSLHNNHYKLFINEDN